MTRREAARLHALVRKLDREASGIHSRARRDYRHAGHSHSEGGTGDEGWTQVHVSYGKAAGLRSAAVQLHGLLSALEVVDPRPKKGVAQALLTQLLRRTRS